VIRTIVKTLAVLFGFLALLAVILGAGALADVVHTYDGPGNTGIPPAVVEHAGGEPIEV
jgi:hypothetical protein